MTEGAVAEDREASGPPGGRQGAEKLPAAMAIMGPTATGKTSLSVRVARRLDGEVVSVDSRQAYRGMEVGTAAPDPELRQAVPHHGVAFLDPGQRYSAGEFARRARRWIREIDLRGRVPVLAGGTGFFLRALTDPVFREPEMGEERRRRLRRWLSSREPEALRRWTGRLDPGLGRQLSSLDPQRCSRTLELALLSGRPLTWWHRHGPPEAPPLDALVTVLVLSREAHRRRIRSRIRQQFEEGWPEEVRRLLAGGHDMDSPPFDALGYGEVAAYLRGDLSREEAEEEIFRSTWAYARRQRTWFRHQVPDDSLRLDAGEPVESLAKRAVEAWRRWRAEGTDRDTNSEGRSTA